MRPQIPLVRFQDQPEVLCCRQIKAVYYNNTPIANTPVYLFEGEVWSSRRLKNLTTNSNGIAAFSFCSARLKGDLWLQVPAHLQDSAAFSPLLFVTWAFSFPPGLPEPKAAAHPIQG